MRCITPTDVSAILGPSGFSVSLEHGWYRRGLVLEESQARRQTRIGGRPTIDPVLLAQFALSMVRWLPTARHRMLWIDHWDSDYPAVSELFNAARAGMNETRSISAAPGHLFDPHPYDQEDQTEIPPEQAKQVGVLVGLMALIMIGGWDAWLVANGSIDRVEFWEGNIFFHTSDPVAHARAAALLTQFKCSRQLA
jgi:hypothetical protein